MSVQDYMSALKLGKKEYHACVNKGKYPYLPVMENMMEEKSIDSEVSLGIDQIPLRLVVGTCTAGRTNAFADNWMPILEWAVERQEMDLSRAREPALRLNRPVLLFAGCLYSPIERVYCLK